MAAAPHRVMAATPIVRRAFCIDPKSDSRGVEDGAGVSGARRSLVSVGTITAGGAASSRPAESRLLARGPVPSRGCAAEKARGLLVTCALAQRCEYIWSDGSDRDGSKGPHSNSLRSKTLVLPSAIDVGGTFPDWTFDGSSTGQADGRDSDCILRPVFSCPDPIRGGNNLLVLCEVMKSNGAPHDTNTRAQLRAIIDPNVEAEAPLFKWEQEYTMFGKNGRVYGWPEDAFPKPQGEYYCGVGLEQAYGRPLAEAHMDACLKAGLTLSGINAEVMPFMWKFDVGLTGPLETGDMVLMARWLLYRLGEDFGIVCSLAAKPVPGDWNGGMAAIDAAMEKLAKAHAAHIAVYGVGKLETCNIATFKAGVADRGCSLRVPRPVALAGAGYFEDRRPAANADPYTVVRMLLTTVLKR